jgi:cardiolipin synthase
MSSGSQLYNWLRTGHEAFEAMLAAITAATKTVRLEMYIYDASPIGDRFRDELVAAARRGLEVRVLIDALGSVTLPFDYWETFIQAGGQFKWFNRLQFNRLGLRDHRKILVCDDEIAFIGGFNIATEYEGNGVTQGWRDLGMVIRSELAVDLSKAVDLMFDLADFKPRRFTKIRKARDQIAVVTEQSKLLLSSPGFSFNVMKHSLYHDLSRADHVKIVSAYFLPTRRLRKELLRIRKRGGLVQLVLPALSDVPLSQMATRSLYRRLLMSGIEIYEYQPQILHAKMILMPQAAYVGSSNLDVRSFHSNYELLVRVNENTFIAEGEKLFAEILSHSKKLNLQEWKKSRTLYSRVMGKWAFFVLAKLDPFLTRQQLKLLT